MTTGSRFSSYRSHSSPRSKWRARTGSQGTKERSPKRQGSRFGPRGCARTGEHFRGLLDRRPGILHYTLADVDVFLGMGPGFRGTDQEISSNAGLLFGTRRCLESCVAVGSPLARATCGGSAVGITMRLASRNSSLLCRRSRCSEATHYEASVVTCSCIGNRSTLSKRYHCAATKPSLASTKANSTRLCESLGTIIDPISPTEAFTAVIWTSHPTGRHCAPPRARGRSYRHPDCRGAVVVCIGFSRHDVDAGAVVVSTGRRWHVKVDPLHTGARRVERPHRIRADPCISRRDCRVRRAVIAQCRSGRPQSPLVEDGRRKPDALPRTRIVDACRGIPDHQVWPVGRWRCRSSNGGGCLSAGEVGEIARRTPQQAHDQDRTVGEDQQLPPPRPGPKPAGEAGVTLFELLLSQHGRRAGVWPAIAAGVFELLRSQHVRRAGPHRETKCAPGLTPCPDHPLP